MIQCRCFQKKASRVFFRFAPSSALSVLVLYLTSFLSLGCTAQVQNSSDFKLHLFQQPQSLDPGLSRSSSGGYFFHNLMRGLYVFDEDKGLQPEGGHCTWQNNLKLVCNINVDHKWSDGSAVLSAHYVESFRRIVDPTHGSPRAHLLESLKNARQIIEGQLPVEKLGLREISPREFELDFDREDADFLFKLTSTALLPRHPKNKKVLESWRSHLASGPYTIKGWKPGQWLLLEKNPHYLKGHPERPPVRFYFIDKDQTAFRLYEKGELDFLRRVVVSLIPKVKNRVDFFQKAMARFDYIGFGPRLRPLKKLREALATSINYPESQVLLHALGPLGCSSLPVGWASEETCYSFNAASAQAALKQVAALPPALTYEFSRLGGDDLVTQSEWIQNQWKINIGLKVEISPVEQGSYLRKLNTSPPDIFRKGVGLDYPSCLVALQTFTKKSSRNYLKFHDSKYETLLTRMSKERDPETRRKQCHRGLQILMDDFHLIPLGKMHFSMLARPKYEGWRLNSLNQLDLSQLHKKTPEALNK